MDVRQLRQVLAVADELHFGRAADRLGMTQPPLSQAVKALEDRLGAPLFERTRRSVSVTDFGAQWLPLARKALAGFEDLQPAAERILHGHAGRLELSFVSTADYSILPQLVQRFRALYPAVELSLTEATSDRQIAALAAGQGHAGIIIPHQDAPLPQGFSYRQLLVEPLVAAVPEAWIAEGRVSAVDGALAPEAIVSAPLIVFPRRAAPLFHDLVLGYFTAFGGQARIVQEAIQMQTIISLVSAGMGIALVPESLRNMARVGVRYLPLAEAAPVLETGIVWRGDDGTPTLGNFLGMLDP